MTQEFLPYIKLSHTLFLSFFLGGQFYYLFILQPASHEFFSDNEQIRFLQNVLKRQNPILLFALCCVVLTGGFMITPLKTSLGADYYTVFGHKLLIKLIYFFGVFFVTAYQTLSVGFKIRFLSPESMKSDLAKNLYRVRRLMTITSILNIIIVSVILFFVAQS